MEDTYYSLLLAARRQRDGAGTRASPSVPDWDTKLTSFLDRNPIGGQDCRGARWKARQTLARQYLLGQILPGERKSMEPMAARVPGATYDQMQHFITYAPWDPEATYDGVIRTMMEVTGSPESGLLIDDTGTPKEGRDSPGVASQYCGASHGIDNCQVAVSCVCARQGHPRNADLVAWSVGMHLYLPKKRAEDLEHRKKAGIPDDVVYRKKHDLALDLIAKARRFKILHRFIGADAFFGDVGPFRAQLRAWNEAYVLAVTVSELHVIPEQTPVHPAGTRRLRGGKPYTRPWLDPRVKIRSAKEMASRVRQWRRIRWGEGTKGPLESEFARVRVRVCRKHRTPTEEVGWLLLERKGDEIQAHLCVGLDDSSLEDLVRMAHLRWGVEDVYEELKRELGWDHFEGRKWLGWNHHAVLSQMALAFLAWLRMETPRGPDESFPTIPEVRREIVRRLVATLREIAKEGPPEKREAALRYLEDLIVYAG